MMGAEPMLLVEYCEGGDLRRALNLDNSTRVWRALKTLYSKLTEGLRTLSMEFF